MAVVGGTTSQITGGKFANGAISGAFVHLFNAEMKKYTLGIHTNASKDGLNPTRGHAWISIMDNETGDFHTYGLFANQELLMYESDGTGEVRRDFEILYSKFVTNHFEQITQSQYDSIAVYLTLDRNSMVWQTNYTCANYAIDIFNIAVGTTYESTRFPANLAKQIGY